MCDTIGESGRRTHTHTLSHSRSLSATSTHKSCTHKHTGGDRNLAGSTGRSLSKRTKGFHDDTTTGKVFCPPVSDSAKLSAAFNAAAAAKLGRFGSHGNHSRRRRYRLYCVCSRMFRSRMMSFLCEKAASNQYGRPRKRILK